MLVREVKKGVLAASCNHPLKSGIPRQPPSAARLYTWLLRFCAGAPQAFRRVLHEMLVEKLCCALLPDHIENIPLTLTTGGFPKLGVPFRGSQ